MAQFNPSHESSLDRIWPHRIHPSPSCFHFHRVPLNPSRDPILMVVYPFIPNEY